MSTTDLLQRTLDVLLQCTAPRRLKTEALGIVDELRAALKDAAPAAGELPARVALTLRDTCLIQAALLCLAQVVEQTDGNLTDDIRVELPADCDHPGDEASDLAARLADSAIYGPGDSLVLPIRPQALRDLLTTAVEGGIGYWVGTVHKLERDPESLDVLMLVADVAEGPVTVDNPEIAAAEIRQFTLTPDMLVQGINRMLSPYGATKVNATDRAALANFLIDEDSALWDADTADCVVQMAVFGELVFG